MENERKLQQIDDVTLRNIDVRRCHFDVAEVRPDNFAKAHRIYRTATFFSSFSADAQTEIDFAGVMRIGIPACDYAAKGFLGDPCRDSPHAKWDYETADQGTQQYDYHRDAGHVLRRRIGDRAVPVWRCGQGIRMAE